MQTRPVVAVLLLSVLALPSAPAAAEPQPAAPPVLSWVSPSEGAALQGDGQELVVDAAVDPSTDAVLERVEVVADGQPVGQATDNDQADPLGGTYRLPWDTTGLKGTRTLVATAVDSSGATASATRTVTLRQPSCPEDLRLCPAPRIALGVPVSTAGQSVAVTVRGEEGAPVELLAYSRPSTTYRVIRSGQVSGGSARFTIAPTTNTRLYARYRGATAGSVATALPVRMKVSGFAAEDPYEGLDFVGGGLRPARAKAVQVYRVLDDGRRVPMFRTGAFVHQGVGHFGEYYGFTRAGRYVFVATTAADSLNAAGESPRFSYTVRYPVRPEYAGVIDLGA